MSATYTIDNSILEKMINANQMMSEALTELFIQKKREETKEKEEVWIVTKDAAEIALMSGAGVR